MPRTIRLMLALILAAVIAPRSASAADAAPVVAASHAAPLAAPDALEYEHDLDQLQRRHRVATAGLAMTAVGGVIWSLGAVSYALDDDIHFSDGATVALMSGALLVLGGLPTMLAGTHATARHPWMRDTARTPRNAMWAGLGMMLVSIPVFVLADDSASATASRGFLVVSGAVTAVSASAVVVTRGARVLDEAHRAEVSAAPVWQRDMRGAMLRVSW